jgi:hypothetical protein
MSMEGRYTENAGAVFWDVHGRTVHRKRRSSFLGCPWQDGTQKTQEQFSGMAMEGRYTENAEAVFWDEHAV